MRALLLTLCFLSVPALAARVVVLDISSATKAEVSQLKQLPADAWWLEMGERMVLVEAPETLWRQAGSFPVLQQLDGVNTDRLFVRPRGCSVHSEERGKLVVAEGRWELRALSAIETFGLDQLRMSGWKNAPRNQSIARQYRLDVDGPAAAPQPPIQAVVNAIDGTRWFADVQTLSAWDRSSYGSTSLVAARDWIGSQFQSLGLAVSMPAFNMSAPGGSIVRNNVIGTYTGISLPNEWVIVGAHYDSRNVNLNSTSGAPGAEDNASGCVGVIEIARALLPAQPARSILFMCYAGEEQDLLGSRAHVQSLLQSGDLSKVGAVVIMDMIGYSSDSNLQALYESSEDFNGFPLRFGAAAATYVPQLDVVTSTNPFGSDHVPYLQQNVQTLLAIENDWDVYPHYHRSSDTPTNMGPHAEAMGTAILKTNAAVLAELSGIVMPLFADGFE